MEYAPYAISKFLYSGIQEEILTLLKSKETWTDHQIADIHRIGIAIEWYKEHCIVSTSFLVEGYEKILTRAKSDNVFLYDADNYLRYTLISKPLEGKSFEMKNQLINRNDLPYKEIEIGKIVKNSISNQYIKITEVFHPSNHEHGYFIAESLLVSELINLKGGVSKK